MLQLVSAVPKTAEEVPPAVSYQIATCDYDANAICSLKWNEQEFINEYDHGRQLQSAAQFGSGQPNNWTEGENYNPTEAGGLSDGLVKQSSSSISLYENLSLNGPVLLNKTQMAYWKPVGGVKLSNWTLDKKMSVALGCKVMTLSYAITFSANQYERYNAFGQFEILTAYLLPKFSSFWSIDLKGTQNIASITTEKQEQKLPLIFATLDGTYAMGIYNPNLPQATFPNDGYGTWRYNENLGENYSAVKLNTVERHYNPGQSKSFKVYLFIGSLIDVAAQMRSMYNSGQLN